MQRRHLECPPVHERITVLCRLQLFNHPTRSHWTIVWALSLDDGAWFSLDPTTWQINQDIPGWRCSQPTTTRRRIIIILLPPEMPSSALLAMNASPCTPASISQKPRVKTSPKFLLVACDTLYTSGFVDDIMFSHHGQAQATRMWRLFQGLISGSTGAKSDVYGWRVSWMAPSSDHPRWRVRVQKSARQWQWWRRSYSVTFAAIICEIVIERQEYKNV